MFTKQFPTRPIYLQLRDALIERLARGHWKAGEALPNEVDLAREFGVSSGTVRKALDMLEGDRRVTRKQGRGTFVNDPTSDDLVVRFSNIRDAKGHRITGIAETGKITQCAASEQEVARLHLQPNDAVYRLRRFRYHVQRLFMVEDASLPVKMFPGLPKKDGPSDCVVMLSHRHGVLLSRGEERVCVSTVETAVTDRLGLPAGRPIMTLDRVVFRIDGRPVEWRIGYCHLVDECYVAEMA
jgi:GntR family transcriptional regulator